MTKVPLDFVWSSLPMPALLIDPKDLITETNPAAEGFFNNSGKSLCGTYIWDRLNVDAPLENSFARAREFETPLFVNDVEVGATGQALLRPYREEIPKFLEANAGVEQARQASAPHSGCSRVAESTPIAWFFGDALHLTWTGRHAQHAQPMRGYLPL